METEDARCENDRNVPASSAKPKNGRRLSNKKLRKKMKMLKRHLSTEHGMTPDEYRARWDLGADYPLVAPNYAETRRKLAKQMQYADRAGIRFVILFGDEEAGRGVVKVKDLKSQEQFELTRDEMAAALKVELEQQRAMGAR